MKIAIAASFGGHLTELQMILNKEVLGNNQTFILTEKSSRTQKIKNAYYFRPLGNNVFLYPAALFKCIKIFRKEKPSLLITNGAEIGLPAIIAAKLLRLKTIYLDISAAATIPTMAGKLCYYFSDIFLVQYPEMAKHYGKKARYEGGVI